jgi:hypothetical protein
LLVSSYRLTSSYTFSNLILLLITPVRTQIWWRVVTKLKGRIVQGTGRPGDRFVQASRGSFIQGTHCPRYATLQKSRVRTVTGTHPSGTNRQGTIYGNHNCSKTITTLQASVFALNAWRENTLILFVLFCLQIFTIYEFRTA